MSDVSAVVKVQPLAARRRMLEFRVFPWCIDLKTAVKRDSRTTRFGRCLDLTPTLPRVGGFLTHLPAVEGLGMRVYDIGPMLNGGLRIYLFSFRTLP